jgi:hypothetical protein
MYTLILCSLSALASRRERASLPPCLLGSECGGLGERRSVSLAQASFFIASYYCPYEKIHQGFKL